MFKLHENLIVSFLKLCSLFNFTFANQQYIAKVVKIAYLSGDLSLGILNLNDDMLQYWNYVQPIIAGNKIRFLCILA